MQAPANVDDASGERVSVRSPLIGSVVGERYRVLALLGSGGMAEVYEVEHVELGRRFALKVLRQELCENSSVVGRFERESRSVSRLVSEHIVGIVDVGETQQGAPYFVMERLQGQELRRLLEQEGLLSVARALHLALDVCRALSVAHAAGIVHRDLKPENLFVVRASDGAEHCKVLDFGVAKLAQENPTLPGTLVGTARYMAPEQITGDSEKLGPATDLFALGAILFECLAGKPAFEADTLERVLFKIVSEPIPSLSTLRPELPAPVAQLVEMLLRKDARERPQSADEVLRLLHALTPGELDVATQLTAIDLSRAVGPLPAAPRTARRWLWLLPAVFTVGFALGAFVSKPPPTTTITGNATAPASIETMRLPVVAATAPNEHSPPPTAAKPSASPVRPPAPRAIATATPSAPSVPTSAKPPLFFPSESP